MRIDQESLLSLSLWPKTSRHPNWKAFRVSFPEETRSRDRERNEKLTIMTFIFVSTCILIFIGKPASLLILAGSVNGLILPITLAVMLFATHKSEIVGTYKHNKLLYYTGWIVVLVTSYIGVTSLKGIAKLLG